MASQWNSASAEDVRKGATIRALRDAYGLSTVELATAIDVSPRYISAIETGHRPAPIRLCRAIADVLKVPLAAITVEGYEQIRDAAESADQSAAS